MNFSLFLLGGNRTSQCKQAQERLDCCIYDIYICEQGIMFGARVASGFIWSTVLFFFFYDKVTFLKCLNVLPSPADGKMEYFNRSALLQQMTEQGPNSVLLCRGQRSTPFTSAVSRVMVNSLSVCRMREREWTAARSRSRAASSYVRAVRGNSASRGSH